MRRATCVVFCLALFTGCEGRITSSRPDGSVIIPGVDAGCPPEGRNDEVRLALAPACASCHLTGNKPYFASLSAFENGLVYDPKWVVRGDPDASGLVKLLLGTNPGSYPQMPPGEPFENFVRDHRVSMSIDDVKAWIRELPERGAVDEGPSPEAFTVRRLRADEMVLSLLDQLGLGPEDFVDTSSSNWRNEAWNPRGGRLFVWPGDWAPGISGQYVSDSRSVERYESLGGAAVLQGRKGDVGLGPAALQTLTQMSQAWCGRAIDKPGNTAVLRFVTLADKSDTRAADIKRNVGQLWLRMLGDVPSDAELEALYRDVYLPLEATSTRTAWVGTCAALVRHPKWLSY